MVLRQKPAQPEDVQVVEAGDDYIRVRDTSVLTTINEGYCTRVAAGLGVLIAILEAVQQLNQYQGNWSNYRATSEVLKHEKYLVSGPSWNLQDSGRSGDVCLAERLETLIAQEESKWMNLYAEGPQTHSRAAADRP